ncbi:glycoside hydrolase family 43 protein [Microlunatus speluncae]|uniref:glycoside hydrolase family 43 protein n=1 Tax=Microlunatus speluncae TaxID=2594267 RepID=UPI0012662BEF|nr:glycoside hydrolase 43 family protein [Microlunatus speluncae]
MINYHNPILDADWPDPDVIRVGDTFYLVASSFNRAPGLPLLTSTDLVHWRPIGHALPAVPPYDHYRLPRHGSGVWAPALRHHAGRFWIFYPDPDHGIFMINAERAEGPWSAPHLVYPGRGLIDPCPLWDDDGRAYLVHGWAKSRAGINNRLSVCPLAPDGTTVLGPSRTVIDGDQLPGYRTLEGPKFYRRDGWYWIFAPAGGVADGWQSVFRSRSVWGPYQDRIVLARGSTDINGPHQGAWVDTPAGEDWFVHFSDRGPYGRVVHLQPLRWAADGWPELGRPTGSGPGEPVRQHPMPRPSAAGSDEPSRTDDFTGTTLGPQWHWQANPADDWAELRGDGLLLLPVLGDDPGNLRDLPRVLGQTLPGRPSSTTVELHLDPDQPGARAGLVVLGERYAWIGLEIGPDGPRLVCRQGGPSPIEEPLAAPEPLPGDRVSIRVDCAEDATCRFAWRPGAEPWRRSDITFTATAGRWIGAELGLFATAPFGSGRSGTAHFGQFTVTLSS